MGTGMELPGLKLAYMIAGFAGGVVSLRYIKDLNWWQGLLSVATGALVANYMTPILQFYLKMPESLEFGCAFIVGFIALNLMGGIFRRSEQFRDNPKIPGEGDNTNGH